MNSERTRNIGLFALIAIASLALSQLSSFLVNGSIPQGETVVVNSLLHLTHVRNMGGVFGVFQGQGWIFGLFSFALITALVIYLLRGRDLPRYEFICFGFIVGGGASNVLDRLIYGSVVDFINVQQIPYWQYVFNTADMLIHAGLWPMLYFTLRHGQKRDNQAS